MKNYVYTVILLCASASTMHAMQHKNNHTVKFKTNHTALTKVCELYGMPTPNDALIGAAAQKYANKPSENASNQFTLINRTNEPITLILATDKDNCCLNAKPKEMVSKDCTGLIKWLMVGTDKSPCYIGRETPTGKENKSLIKASCPLAESRILIIGKNKFAKPENINPFFFVLKRSL